MDEHQPAGAARAESYLTALTVASKTPGVQYLMVNATGVLFEYAGGWADIRRQVPEIGRASCRERVYVLV